MVSPTQSDLHETKRAILNAAERVFAEQGFHAASLRTLTAQANVNLGAVNYHFSTKDELVLAVLRRRIQPLNERRLLLLSRFQKEAGAHPVSPEKILEALFRPLLEAIASRGQGGRHFIRLIAQCLAEPARYLQPLIREEFAEKNRRFHTALAEALPFLSSEEVHWRLHFAQGVFLHTITNAEVLRISSNGRCQIADAESLLQRVISFCSAGLRAAVPQGEGKKWK